MENVDFKKKGIIYCPRCGIGFHAQLHRPRIIKTLFPFIPIRKYYCTRCRKKSYVIVD